MDDFARVFSNKLRHYINVKEVTQEQVADYVGVTPATISYWCKGTRVPRMDKIDSLCSFFGCTRDDLLSDKTPSNDARSHYDLSLDEKVLVEWYRNAPEHDLDFLRRMIAYSELTKKE